MTLAESVDVESLMQPGDPRLRPRWMKYAACRGMPVDVFFPVRGDNNHEAKAVCAGCVVRRACLEYVNGGEAWQKHGTYGGLTARARNRGRSHGRRPVDGGS
jgi:WhiB family redox-sensing transcriptional regulator